MLGNVYEKVLQKITLLVSSENAGDKISFTTDCWPGSTDSLMSLMAHFIDQNWKRQQVILNVQAMTGSYCTLEL